MKIGDTVRITNFRSAYYLRTGKLVGYGANGGVYVKHNDGVTVYHPWGWDRLR